eukprot:scaffold269_cov229-Pinguiococcus_pyrenoidosus.AAC.9
MCTFSTKLFLFLARLPSCNGFLFWIFMRVSFRDADVHARLTFAFLQSRQQTPAWSWEEWIRRSSPSHRSPARAGR